MSPTRRYPLGFSFVALLAVAVVVVFAFLFPRLVEQGGRDQLEAEVRDLARHVEAVVRREVRATDRRLRPEDLRWPDLDRALTAPLETVPHFIGLELLQPSSEETVTLVRVGRRPSWAASLADDSQPGLSVGDDGRARFTFRLELPEGEVVSVRGWFLFDTLVRDQARSARVAVFGMIVLGIVVYVLAVLAILMSRAHARAGEAHRLRTLRMEAVGDLVGGVAHEVRNPLNGLSLSIQYLERKAVRSGVAPASADFARAHGEVGRVQRVVDELARCARMGELVLGAYGARELFEEALAGFATDPTAPATLPPLEARGALAAHGDRSRLREVLAAVLHHVFAVGPEEPSEPRSVCVVGTRQRLTATIARGILPELIAPDAGRGTERVAMIVARALLESHGGTVGVERAEGAVRVTLSWPRRFGVF